MRNVEILLWARVIDAGYASVVRSADRKRGLIPMAGEGAQEAKAGRPIKRREVGGIFT